MDLNLDKLKDFLDSPEGQKALNDQVKKWAWDDTVKRNWIIKLEDHTKGNDKLLDEIIYKVINKYNSDEYQNRWYKRHIMPLESLLFLIYDYIQLYGRETHPNSDIYHYRGWSAEIIHGQGSVCKVWKETLKETWLFPPSNIYL